jgi:GAF domain-containing protein
VIKASEGSLMLKDEETGELVFTVAISEASRPLIGFRLPPGEGVAGWVAEHGEPQVVRDVYQDRRFSPLVDQLFDFGTRSLVAVPLLDGLSPMRRRFYALGG